MKIISTSQLLYCLSLSPFFPLSLFHCSSLPPLLLSLPLPPCSHSSLHSLALTPPPPLLSFLPPLLLSLPLPPCSHSPSPLALIPPSPLALTPPPPLLSFLPPLLLSLPLPPCSHSHSLSLLLFVQTQHVSHVMEKSMEETTTLCPVWSRWRRTYRLIFSLKLVATRTICMAHPSVLFRKLLNR